jgi:hypothetical protein
MGTKFPTLAAVTMVCGFLSASCSLVTDFDRSRILAADAGSDATIPDPDGSTGKPDADAGEGGMMSCNPADVVPVVDTCPEGESCPARCDDGVACTLDAVSTAEAQCSEVCNHTEISACVNGDGCCPAGCDAASDADCTSSCGNGVTEVGETCDPTTFCPTECNDGTACTTDTKVGSIANCNVACSFADITSCMPGDSCCPAGCNSNNDSDCSVTCNNGVVEAGETCDPRTMCPASCDDGNACTIDGLTGSAANCNVACSHQTISQCKSGDGCCPSGCNAVSDKDCSASCGNSVVEPGEACDPAASCPTPASCNDGTACTIDNLIGSAMNCTATCSHQSITQCVTGDGCCAPGCNAVSDKDCSASCGNSVVEPGETCDPAGSCPRSCDDGSSCTIDSLTGSAANCTAACGHQAITQCRSGDGCCPSGCNAVSDNDCSASCGNSVVEPGETCDPVSSCPTLARCNDGTACTIDNLVGSRANCTATCSHQAITQCVTGDGCCAPGCNAVSDKDCSASCGNSVVEPGETCDPPGSCPRTCDDGSSCTIDALTGSAANCTAACSHQAITQCRSGDGCCAPGCNAVSDNDCSASCGNSVVEPGETCDPVSTCPTAASCSDGNACTIDNLSGSRASCTATCTHQSITQCVSGDSCCAPGCNANTDSECSASCGNRIVEPGETCDPQTTCPSTCSDGNACTIDVSTGSTANCNLSCSHQTITQCVGGDLCCAAGCNANTDGDCTATCGNGVVERGETCDPATSCPAASCDDAVACTADTSAGSAANCNLTCTHSPITQCQAGDGCCAPGCNANSASPSYDPNCTATCGNNVVEPGETCDPVASCPVTCDDNNACTVDTSSGQASTCNRACSHNPITTAVNGDRCCPPGNTNATDSDCPVMDAGIPTDAGTLDAATDAGP